jgi:hypothetical protein
MRLTLAALSLPLFALAACGDSTAPQTVGGIATPTPTPTPGSTDTFLSTLTAAGTFDAVGGLQSLSVQKTTNPDGSVSNASLYQGNAATVRASSGHVDYDPRDGIFTLTLLDSKAGVNRTERFQDPGHRTTQTQPDVPDLPNFNYLEDLDGATALATFFYERPGTTTAYVSLAGFSRNDQTVAANVTTTLSERGAFVFGSPTASSQVPKSGTGSYAGDFLASTVDTNSPNSLQWLSGTSQVDVDFAKLTVGVTLTSGSASSTSFSAKGSATIDMVHNNGFSGSFQSATLGGQNVDFTSVNPATNTAGASSIDGTFYGPNAVNVGGSFRITGGVPNTRIDVVGAFVGAKK